LNPGQLLSRVTTARALIIGLCLAAFYYFAFFDQGMQQSGEIATNKARLAELQTQLADAQQKLDNAAIYKKTAAEVGTTIGKLLTLIPEKFGQSDLMRIVSNEAKSSGSSLAAIEPKSTEISVIAPEFEEVTVGVELQGSFLQHMVFLSNLTKVNQILIVRKFELNHLREGRGDEAPVVSLKADIVAYRYRGKEAAKASAEGAAQ
jgi:Tfp pilus assembly protein PilO